MKRHPLEALSNLCANAKVGIKNDSTPRYRRDINQCDVDFNILSKALGYEDSVEARRELAKMRKEKLGL